VRKENKMREDESRNHQRVVAERVEFRVGETEDYAEYGRADISEQHGPEGGDLPVLFTADNVV
ncbi:hypothetical protein COL922a_014881, partial [Colletotrichum nupharicola]